MLKLCKTVNLLSVIIQNEIEKWANNMETLDSSNIQASKWRDDHPSATLIGPVKCWHWTHCQSWFEVKMKVAKMCKNIQPIVKNDMKWKLERAKDIGPFVSNNLEWKFHISNKIDNFVSQFKMKNVQSRPSQAISGVNTKLHMWPAKDYTFFVKLVINLIN